MKLIDKFRKKTEGLTNKEIAEELALKVKSRLVHRYRHAKTLFANTEITDEKLGRALTLPAGTNLLDYFKGRERPLPYAGISELAVTCEIYSDYFSNTLEETIQEADAICRHEFNFLGHEHKYSEEEINWHYDTVNGYEWPQVHYSQIQIANAKAGSDIKIPWELARLQHFTTLGIAYQLTNDERYAIEFCNQVLSFARANPPEMGIHWLCAMEVALRAVSLTNSFYLFRNSPNFDEETLKALLKMLLAHATYIEENLEYSVRITSNHYLSDLVGLLFTGILFPEFKKSGEWAQFALGELLKEMDKQVFEDGVNWEASTGYHAFVLEIFLYAFLLCKRQGTVIENRYWQKLEKMFEFVHAYLKPDGSAPLIGDCDDGKVIVWRRRAPTDHSYLLPIAAIIFEQERYKITGQPCEEALWLFGSTGWDTYDSLSFAEEQPASAAFPAGGVYVQRDDNLYAIIDCGEVGINGQGSHGHNDMLSFELYYRDSTFIVDPGSYIYTGDPVARNLFRSTAYHNTVMIDGVELNEIYPGQLFVIGNQALPKINAWESTAEFDLLDAEHNGYQRLPQGVVHRRQFLFNKLGCYWLITDRLTGTGTHDIQFFFNFDAGLGIELAGGSCVLATNEDAGVTLAIAPVENDGLKAQLVERYVSKGYGQRTSSWGVVYSVRAAVPLERRFLIAPCSENDLSGIEDLIDAINHRESDDTVTEDN